MAHLSGLHLRECSAALLRRARVNGLKSPETLPSNDGFWQEEEGRGRGREEKKQNRISAKCSAIARRTAPAMAFEYNRG